MGFDIIAVLGFVLSLVLAVREWLLSRPRIQLHDPCVYLYRDSKRQDTTVLLDVVVASSSARPVSLLSVSINGTCCEQDDHCIGHLRLKSSGGEDEIRTLCTAGMPLTLQPFEARRIRVCVHLQAASLEKSLSGSRSWTYTPHSLFAGMLQPPADIPRNAIFDLGLHTNCNALFRRPRHVPYACKVRPLSVLLNDMLQPAWAREY